MQDDKTTQSTDTIYVLSDKDNLQIIPRRHYESEDLFQSLIEKHPDILAGDQMGGDEPIRFVLVKREAGIPDGNGVPDRWSVDHLLLDQYGKPTLVEVKRSSDTRIRREVVGQLLEYAANVDIYWPSDKIRTLAVEQHGGSEGLNDAIIQLLGLGPEADTSQEIDNYWAMVERNVQESKLRLLFVADELPREVRRIIEFLNSQMADVDVLGVELRQYVGDGLRAMVPRVIGQTEKTKAIKKTPGQPLRHTTRQEIVASCPPDIQPFINEMIDEAERRNVFVYWGLKGFSLRGSDQTGALQSLLYCFPPGANGAPIAYIEGFLSPILRGNDLGQRFADSLLGISGFSRRGEYTFHLDLLADTLESAKQALNVVWDIADKLSGI